MRLGGALLQLVCVLCAARAGARLVYRRASPLEYRAIGELRTSVFCPTLSAIGSRYLQTRVFIEAMSKKSAVLVALTQGEGGIERVVGSSDLQIEDISHLSHVEGDCVGYVTNVCVSADARRRGIGRGLMSLAEAVCIDHGASELLLHVEPHNHTAERLYRSIGFRERSQVASCQAITQHFFQLPFYDPAASPQMLMMMRPDPSAPRVLEIRAQGGVAQDADIQDTAMNAATASSPFGSFNYWPASVVSR